VKLAKGIRKLEGPYSWRARVEGAGTEIRGSVEVVGRSGRLSSLRAWSSSPADEIKGPGVRLNLKSFFVKEGYPGLLEAAAHFADIRFMRNGSRRSEAMAARPPCAGTL
jgi:hypothetical protein